MSNIYIQEPPTNGKVLLKTTVGDIDLELWSKETPKACRNFVQLCMEGYYNGTIFHRIVKGFIVQGGDPTGSGMGGESIYGHPFKDEFHSRLRFNRRGLIAMANAGRDDNSSQFFFTLGATPELQNKHTIFGKITGETLFNMLKLEDALVDKDDRPMYPQKIIKAEILSNPFSDIVPRTVPQSSEKSEGTSEKRKKKKSGVKNFKLLSFGEEAEEDEEESNVANKKYSGRSKSTHDVLNDPCLSAVPAVETVKRKEQSDESDPGLSGDELPAVDKDFSEKESDEVSNIRKKLKSSNELSKPIQESNVEEDSVEELPNKNQKKVDDIRKEIKDLKKELHGDKKRKEEKIQEEISAKRSEDTKSETLEVYKKEQEKYKQLKEKIPKKGSSREDFTLALLAKFQKKLASAKEKAQEKAEDEEEHSSQASNEKGNEDDVDDEDWLTHKLQFEVNAPVLAKDASTKSDDWFEIYDPRNPINKRRRENSKDLMKNKDKR